LDSVVTVFACMSEYYIKNDLIWRVINQAFRVFRFPVIQSFIIEFDNVFQWLIRKAIASHMFTTLLNTFLSSSLVSVQSIFFAWAQL
jgi:hypothetical protein